MISEAAVFAASTRKRPRRRGPPGPVSQGQPTRLGSGHRPWPHMAKTWWTKTWAHRSFQTTVRLCEFGATKCIQQRFIAAGL
jgi:hypothetical protein